MSALRVLSWNVNGLRAVMKKGLPRFLNLEKPDIIAFQETKSWRSQVDLKSTPGFADYHEYWNEANRKGYSGTLILSKKAAKSIRLGMGKPEFDDEGRVIAAEYDSFVLANVYTPNAKPDLSRLEYRQEWDRMFADYICRLRSELGKPILACGDFNVAHTELDLARPVQNEGKHGFTKQERAGFDHLLANAGLTDTYRELLGNTIGYSYWSLSSGARKNNVGWRIDYFLADKGILPFVKSSFIQEHVEGSDHAPVGVELAFPEAPR